MTWLLQRFGSEQPLTQAGYLNRTFVLAVHAERPWEDPFDTGRPPRTETDEITLDDALAEGCEREARQLEALQPNGMLPDAVSGARSWTPSDRRVRVTYGALGRAQGKTPGTRSPAHQQDDDDDDQNEEK